MAHSPLTSSFIPQPNKPTPQPNKPRSEEVMGFIIPQHSLTVIERKDNIAVMRDMTNGGVTVHLDMNRDGNFKGIEDAHMAIAQDNTFTVSMGGCSIGGKLDKLAMPVEAMPLETLGDMALELGNQCIATLKKMKATTL